MTEQRISAEQIGDGTGKDGRITKGDVLAFLNRPAPVTAPPPAPKAARTAEAGEERVKMTRLRRTIAARLKEAQNTAAMLTTFNEVDMTRHDGAARRISRCVREEAQRRAARLHGLLRARLRVPR